MTQRRYKQGIDRFQETLFPPRLEDYVSEDNPARAIDTYIDSLDMGALGFMHSAPGRNQAGQPAYAPQMLLKLYLYGYLNRLRSSRVLERESQRNVELMWLLEGLQPSYKTIADFRKNNAQALRRVQAEFIALCRALRLFGGQLVAVDGSFFKGNVSPGSFRTHKGLTVQITKLEKRLAQWHQELDAADREEKNEPTSHEEKDLPEKLSALREALKEKIEARDDLERRGKKQHSSVDEDARLLTKRGRQRVAGYNVQIVTDARHKLIVADEVTNEANDQRLLHPMSAQAKAALGVDTLEVIADAGYISSVQYHRCHEEGIYPYLPPPHGHKVASGRLPREAFIYEPEFNRYRCPEGAYLIAKSKPDLRLGHSKQRYRSRRHDCRDCVRQDECLPSYSKAREIWRGEYEADTEAVNQRVLAHPDKLAQRSELVEHPFGTLKRRAGWDHFLVRGMEKVRGEWSLMALAYNFSRVLNLLGIEQFLAICRQLAELLACFLVYLSRLLASGFFLKGLGRLQVIN